MMNIAYITRMRFMSDKAHVYNTAKTCAAIMATREARVSLVSSDDSLMTDADKERYFAKHAVQDRFEVISLGSAAKHFKDSRFRLLNWVEVVLANLSLIKYLKRHRASIDVVYFRDPFVFLAVFYARRILRKPVFFEIHAVLSRGYSQFLNIKLARMSAGLVNISHALDDYYRPYNPQSIVSFCAAAEPERFAHVIGDKTALRQKLGLPSEGVLIGYSGNLFRTGNNDPYGLDDIIRAMPLMEKNVRFAGVGQKNQQETAPLETLARELGLDGRVIFAPWVPKERVAEYLLACDILAIPAAGARVGNSPTKMFEYLVSGRPIVAARTEAIAEVLKDGENSLLVDYRKPEDWARAVRLFTYDQGLRERIVVRALKDGSLYTWSGRGRDIVGFISRTLSSAAQTLSGPSRSADSQPANSQASK